MRALTVSDTGACSKLAEDLFNLLDKANYVNNTLLVAVAVALPVIALASWIRFLLERVDQQFRADVSGVGSDA